MLSHYVWLSMLVMAGLMRLSLADTINGCDTDAVVGYCLGVGCFLGHGSAVCKGVHCLCDVGYCSYNGWQCVETPASTSTISVVSTKANTTTSSATTPIAMTTSTTTTSPSAQTYIDLGVGKCLANGKVPTYMYNVAQENGPTCKQRCSNLNACYGYSESAFGNCLLWTQSGLSGGGAEWGNTHCHIKEPAQLQNTIVARVYVDVGEGKCLASGNDPSYTFHAQGSNCEQLCTEDNECQGYSRSSYGGCLLWTESDLSNGGDEWGSAHCHIKVPSQTYVDLGEGKCLAPGGLGRKPSFKYYEREKQQEGAISCEELCTVSSACHGYSKSLYGGCLLWTQSGLSGGGDDWGAAHCHIKVDAMYYVDLGSGKCSANGRDPSFSYYGNVADCAQLCTLSTACQGYSLSTYGKSSAGNCLLWTQSGLSGSGDEWGGGRAWGDAHCFIKASTALAAEILARPSPSSLATKADMFSSRSERVVLSACILVGASLAALLRRTLGVRRPSPLNSPMLLEA